MTDQEAQALALLVGGLVRSNKVLVSRPQPDYLNEELGVGPCSVRVHRARHAAYARPSKGLGV